MYLALRKCKNDCEILKITLVPYFCPLKPEIAKFSIGFRLNSSCSSMTRSTYEMPWL